jgi:hypothetical protein
MERTSENLEHIEHTEHATHSPFDKRVAMTMAIVAAALAAVTLASHRAHNDTLRFQTEAALKQNVATDTWGEYQARNIRRHQYEAYREMLAVNAIASGKEKDADALGAKFDAKAQQYAKEDLPKLKSKAENYQDEVKSLMDQSEHAHHTSVRFDLGELGIELALVFCSLAVLTKRLGFWFSGMAVGAIGLIVAVTGFMMTPH